MHTFADGDKLLIGKVVGAHDLGIYTRAYTLMLLPMNNIGAVLGQVMFPALSQLQNDLPRFKSAYLSALQAIALVIFPLMIGVAALCNPLVISLLGPQWEEVVPILRILSLVGLVQSIIFPVGWVFTALGKTKEQFHLSIILALAFVGAVGIGILFGIKGVAYAYALWTGLSSWLNLRVAGKLLDLSPQRVLTSVMKLLLMSMIMGMTVFLLDQEVLINFSNLARIGLGSVVGVAIYLSLCLLTSPSYS